MKIYLVKHRRGDCYESDCWDGKAFKDKQKAEEYISDYNKKLTPFDSQFGIDRSLFLSMCDDEYNKIGDFECEAYTEDTQDKMVVEALSIRTGISKDIVSHMLKKAYYEDDDEYYATVVEIEVDETLSN
ncbi:MAG: hypothetical protein ACRDD8_13200 [Bacteroidales bacterium]